MVDGCPHDRPSYYAFESDVHRGIYWMIPISSQTDKFHRIYDSKMLKYGKCDTIMFHDVLGKERAFLIQNMCPVTEYYILNKYIHGNTPVMISGDFSKLLIKMAKNVLSQYKHNKYLIFPDIEYIENELIKTLR